MLDWIYQSVYMFMSMGVEQTVAQCKRCKETLPLVTKNHCKTCRPIYNAYRLKHNLKYNSHNREKVRKLHNANPIYRWGAIVRRDKKLGFEESLTLEQFKQFVAMPCEYCLFPSTGVDRLSNSLGHVVGNVVPACVECNLARGNRFSPDEMRELIGPAIRKAKEARRNRA